MGHEKASEILKVPEKVIKKQINILKAAARKRYKIACQLVCHIPNVKITYTLFEIYLLLCLFKLADSVAL